MDPLTALGLAGNIITFIDFTNKLLTKTIQVYHAADGASTNVRVLENQLQDFIFLSKKLSGQTAGNERVATQQFSQVQVEINGSVFEDTVKHLAGHSAVLAYSMGRPETTSDSVRDVATACTNMADKLLSRLEGLKRKDGRRTWSSLKVALQELWNETEVEAMKNELAAWKQRLELHIIVSLRESLELISNRQRDQFDTLKISMKATIQELMQQNMGLKSQQGERQATAVTLTTGSMSELASHHQKTRQEIIAAVHDALKSRNLPLMDPSELQQPNAISEEATKYSSRLLEAEKELLESLRFPVMLDREEDIPDAEKATFDWIFEDPESNDLLWDNFPEWLGKDEPLYWLTGKAGSGKSTLMKYLFCHSETRSILHEWAGDSELVIAGFFFWNTGSEMQRTQQGLLRSLIYQVLSSHRELVPVVLTETGISGQSTESHIWTASRLRRVFGNIIKQDKVPLKICFFIDGLDEYGGDHAEIAELLKSVAQNDDTKICLSSRPLVVFERAFETSPSLMLQNLTHRDIKAYVMNQFNENHRMLQLQENDPNLATRLAAEIVNKASGVFLWVKLVVQSLFDGLGSYDRGSDLEQRLRDLPDDLIHLYQHMLNNIKPAFYRQQASKLLITVYRAVKPFTLQQLAFADMEDLTIAIKCKCNHFSDEELRKACEFTEGRVKTRCLGLVEVATPSPDPTVIPTYRPVQFMHQSVADFLDTVEVQSQIAESLGGQRFNPFPSLMRAALLELKHLDTEPFQHRQPAMFLAQIWFQSSWTIIKSFMSYAAAQETEAAKPEVELFDELDKVAALLSQLYVAAECRHDVSTPVHWTERRREGAKIKLLQLDGSVLSFALESKLYRYALEVLGLGENPAYRRKFSKSQIKYALLVDDCTTTIHAHTSSQPRQAVRDHLTKASRSRLRSIFAPTSSGEARGVSKSQPAAKLILEVHRYDDLTEEDEYVLPQTRQYELLSQTAFS